MQLGGPGARLLGNRGGLPPADDDTYDCLYLWAIQITLGEGERFVKLDHDGEESAWSDSLEDVLPFALSEDPSRIPTTRTTRMKMTKTTTRSMANIGTEPRRREPPPARA